ncbi:MAG TPA: SDR family oxidoreductase [Candidimonas sp.]|nr:SDR family oxidoreductase [Candidimonas sp.]
MNNNFDLTGKVALLSGAAGGLGAQMARALGLAGAKLVLIGRRQGPLEALAASLGHQGIQALAVPADVADDAQVEAGLDRAQSEYGIVDVVVCAAGCTHQAPAVSLAIQDWDRVLDVNLKGSWLVAAHAARRLIQAQRPGSIIMISSILGHRVAGNLLPYTVSKAGLEHMTRALALEWARHGIRVNALAPGYIETDLNREFFASSAGQAMVRRIPQRRLGRAGDLDGALLLLASDASSYMTGSSIVVDGGHLQSTL